VLGSFDLALIFNTLTAFFSKLTLTDTIICVCFIPEYSSEATNKDNADHQFLLVDLPLGPGPSDVDSTNLSLVISIVSVEFPTYMYS